MYWLIDIHDLAVTITRLTSEIQGKKNIKSQLLKELKSNLNAFYIQKRTAQTDYKLLLNRLSNQVMSKQIENGYQFNRIKHGVIRREHIKELRNLKFINKDCDLLFRKIDLKINELRQMQVASNQSSNTAGFNHTLHFSNLYHMMKLLADFICSNEVLAGITKI